jgi:hypothetical protein
LEVSPGDLSSSDRFAELLRAQGVEPETKISGKDNEIYAFAKTDKFMQELLEDEDPIVQALALARLGMKSTMKQTRAERLGYMSQGGTMPVYLHMYGAHTTRWSGGDKCRAGDTLVVVFDYQKGLTDKRIVDIRPDDLIWDGEEFVAHGGIVFRGYQETIEYQGVRGTADHVVFTQGAERSLAEAARTGERILDCRPPSSKEVDVVASFGSGPRAVSMRVRPGKSGTIKRTKK